MATLIIEIFGWTGALMILYAYFLVTHGKVVGHTLEYQLLNLFGSILLGINTIFNTAYPSAATNIIWMCIALYGLSRSFKKTEFKSSRYQNK